MDSDRTSLSAKPVWSTQVERPCGWSAAIRSRTGPTIGPSSQDLNTICSSVVICGNQYQLWSPTGRAFRTQLWFSGVCRGDRCAASTDRPSHTASGQHATGPAMGRHTFTAIHRPPDSPSFSWIPRAAWTSLLSSVCDHRKHKQSVRDVPGNQAVVGERRGGTNGGGGLT